MTARTTVPQGLRWKIPQCPPSSAARSRMDVMPTPARNASGTPLPLSAISTCSEWSTLMVTVVSEAPECLTVLVMASRACLLYTSDAADEEDSVDLGGRRI